MHLVTFALPLLLQLARTTAAYTLEDVESQISSFRNVSRLTNHKCFPTTSCSLACDFLSSVLPQQASFPNSPMYEFQESRYWSQQQEFVRPACRVAPTSALEVSLVVLTSRVTNCNFAVKSGGHCAYEGASNIADGITIDLMNLDEISLSADKTEVKIGAGNVWYDVYTHLEPFGLTAVGGRVSAIGMGFVLGGGISFVSVQHGLACDNVNTFEVVLADGSIQEITSSSQFSDLFWALRGGGNNFGIVTSFQVNTFSQGDLWAGTIVFPYTPETIDALNNAFYWLAVNTPQDPNAQLILTYDYIGSLDMFIATSDLQYLKPVVNPDILKNFTSIPTGSNSTMRITSLSDLTLEFNNSNPGGFRQSYWTATVGNDPTLMKDILDIWEADVQKIRGVPGVMSSCVLQPLTPSMLKFSSTNGGNALGLDGASPLNLINLVMSWNDSADDDRILAAAQDFIDKAVALAQSRGMGNAFLYQNYAAKAQDVFSGYGAANVKRLQAVSQKYDPQHMFILNQPGYFKLPLP